jgi:hypothetical protein
MMSRTRNSAAPRAENTQDVNETPTPPDREPEPPVEEPPRRRGPHEVPDPPPIDDPRPPKPKKIL